MVLFILIHGCVCTCLFICASCVSCLQVRSRERPRPGIQGLCHDQGKVGLHVRTNGELLLLLIFISQSFLMPSWHENTIRLRPARGQSCHIAALILREWARLAPPPNELRASYLRFGSQAVGEVRGFSSPPRVIIRNCVHACTYAEKPCSRLWRTIPRPLCLVRSIVHRVSSPIEEIAIIRD